MWVSPSLSDGLGNRLFQVAAALGYGERCSLETVFYLPRCHRSSHSSSDLIFKLFPSIRVIEFEEASWKEVGKDEKGFATYEYIAPVSEKCVLHGFRQSHLYFPRTGVQPDLVSALGSEEIARLDRLFGATARKTMFIHIRLGDYKILTHHQIDLLSYWRNCFEALGSDLISQRRLMIFSDEPILAETYIGLFEAAGFPEIVIVKDLGVIQGLYLMSKCDGGAICANSTYSWWGAYLSKSQPIFMPAQWGSGLNAPDIYPIWATKIDTQ